MHPGVQSVNSIKVAHYSQHPPVLKGTGGYFLLRRRQIILSVREAGKNCVGGRNLAGEIQVRVNIGCGRDIAMAQPFLYFFQAHSIGIQQAGAAMSQIMKTYLFSLFFANRISKCWVMKLGLHFYGELHIIRVNREVLSGCFATHIPSAKRYSRCSATYIPSAGP